jgi:hypothetical protein
MSKSFIPSMSIYEASEPGILVVWVVLLLNRSGLQGSCVSQFWDQSPLEREGARKDEYQGLIASEREAFDLTGFKFLVQSPSREHYNLTQNNSGKLTSFAGKGYTTYLAESNGLLFVSKEQ